MKKQHLAEKVRRTKILFKELGCKVIGEKNNGEIYTAGFDNKSGLHGGFFIDRDSRFLEIVYTFSFSSSMHVFIRERLEKMLSICYEYGCYINVQKNKTEILFSLFTKLYFSGLNYYSLKDSLKDFTKCVSIITEIIDIENDDILDEEVL
jgi:hypothetical protein